MQPVINHRAVIVADLSQKLLIDKAIYVLYHEAKMWVKKYDLRSKSFVSINPKYSHLVYAQDDVHLVARVLITFTNL
jgi:phage repressor protein C with HTH and peptisase S24 domain